MSYDERGESVRRARMAYGLGDMELVRRLEAEGWKYDPPKPVLPVVSEAAVRAYDLAYAEAFEALESFRAKTGMGFTVKSPERFACTFAGMVAETDQWEVEIGNGDGVGVADTFPDAATQALLRAGGKDV